MSDTPSRFRSMIRTSFPTVTSMRYSGRPSSSVKPYAAVLNRSVSDVPLRIVRLPRSAMSRRSRFPSPSKSPVKKQTGAVDRRWSCSQGNERLMSKWASVSKFRFFLSNRNRR
jgi:hypothetical protein